MSEEVHSSRNHISYLRPRSCQKDRVSRWGSFTFKQTKNPQTFTSGDEFRGDLEINAVVPLYIRKVLFTLECNERCNLDSSETNELSHFKQAVGTADINTNEWTLLAPGYHRFPCKLSLNDITELPPTFSLASVGATNCGVFWTVKSQAELIDKISSLKGPELLEGSLDLIVYPNHPSPKKLSRSRFSGNTKNDYFGLQIFGPLLLPQSPQKFGFEVDVCLKRPQFGVKVTAELERIVRLKVGAPEPLLRSSVILDTIKSDRLVTGSLNLDHFLKDCQIKNVEPGTLDLEYIKVDYNLVLDYCSFHESKESWNVSVSPPLADRLREMPVDNEGIRASPPQYSPDN